MIIKLWYGASLFYYERLGPKFLYYCDSMYSIDIPLSTGCAVICFSMRVKYDI